MDDKALLLLFVKIFSSAFNNECFSGADVLYKMSRPDPEKRNTAVGSLLKEERKKAGLTQEEVAQKKRNYPQLYFPHRK